MLKISHFSPRRCCAYAKILSDSQRFDSQARVRKKEDTIRHDVQLLDHQDFPRSSRNLDRKIALRRAKNTPVASVRGTISPKLNLGSRKSKTLRERAAQAF